MVVHSMDRLARNLDNLRHVRVLEPAAGGSILAAAALEALLAKPQGKRPGIIELLLYELNARLIPGLLHLCEAISDAWEVPIMQRNHHGVGRSR